MSSAIQVQNLSKTYRIPSLLPFRTKRLTRALQDISFSCPQGKVSCILGPNGAGKTTTIKILAGLVEPDIGTVSLFGEPLSESPVSIHSRVGVLTPNERSFYWRLTGRQNLDFYASLYNLKGNDKKERVQKVLTDTELSQDADKPFRLYSAGMRQKLLLARALINRPSILLLDEPSTHLDPLMRVSVQKLIREYTDGEDKPTVLLCTHDLEEAEELSNHLIFLHEGSVKAEGTIESLRKELQPHMTLKIAFKKMPRPEWQTDIHHKIINRQNNTLYIEIDEKDHIPNIVESAVSHGGKIYSCTHSEEPLSTLFSRIYDGEIH